MCASRAESFCLTAGMLRSNSLPTLHYDENVLTMRKGKRDSILTRKCCESTKVCWWEPDPDYPSSTVDFCMDTSLHGMKYICQSQRHLTERIFWLFGFIFSIFWASLLISDLWIKYIESPVVVTFQHSETTIDQIPFPAITICNMNKVLRSKAESFIAAAQQNDSNPDTLEARKNVFYLDHVCSSTKSFSKRLNFSLNRGTVGESVLQMAQGGIKDGDDEQSDVASFLQKASQECSDMLLKCMWNDEVTNCSDLFKPIETDFGKCCTFNMIPQSLLSKHLNDSRDDPKEVSEWSVWDIENNGLLDDGDETQDRGHERTYPRRQLKAGKTSGLSILLNPQLNEYFCTSSDSQGFRLAKHLSMDVPHVMDLGIAIKPNIEVFMGIKPEITVADPGIQTFRLDKRNCYFQGEMQLAYYKYYTVTNCIDECIANKTFTTCGCVRYYMPRDPTRDLCGPGKFQCAEDVQKASLQVGAKFRCRLCLPSCTELEYFSETSYATIQKGVNIWVDDENLPAQWAQNNVSIVHIFFIQDSTYARVRKELYGFVDLIANTGGILGLCLGFSILSLIELIYFYTFRAWCRVRRRRSIWTIAALKLQRMWKKATVDSNMKQNGFVGRRLFGTSSQQRLDRMIMTRNDSVITHDPFVALPLDFNAKFILGRSFPASSSRHLD